MDLDGRKFPEEIKLKIWRYTLPGRRIISVYQRHEHDNSFTSKVLALHAYKLSRVVASTIFKSAFTQTDTSKISPPIYMDFENDTIHLTSHEAYIKFAESYFDIRMIKSLSIEDLSVSPELTVHDRIAHSKKIGAKFREITIVHQSQKLVGAVLSLRKQSHR